MYSSGKLFEKSSTFEKNAVHVPTLTERNPAGGAVQIEDGTACFEDVTFRQNKARNGGALHVANGDVIVAADFRTGTPTSLLRPLV